MDLRGLPRAKRRLQTPSAGYSGRFKERRETGLGAEGEFRLVALPASFANPLQDGIAGNSLDLRIAKPLAGCFPFLFGELSARWKCFRDLRGLREFRDHSSAKGDREFLALFDSAEKFG